MSRRLLSGDEAVARGAWEAGCRLAAAYPGTPSTEILEALVTYRDVYCEWSTNEKVALEVALGAAISGVRALAAMKHVGLNVAADPLFSAAYIGVRGGLVVVSADDPGLHSSQNEQDNRFYGVAAKVPVLCPADSQEAKDLTRLGFEISERFDIPVLLRITTRIAHTSTVVELGERTVPPARGYEKQATKTIILPAYARMRHVDLERRLDRLREYTENTECNRIEGGDSRIGVVCDGVAYQYAREVFPDVSFLKLGLVYPFPERLVRKFASRVRELVVVEEGDAFIELMCRSLGLAVTGKDRLPRWNELSPGAVRGALLGRGTENAPEPDLPIRPPALCPGCPHTGIFFALQKQNVIIGGDIGCYTLGALPPHNAMDTCIDMGASITFAHGCEKALGDGDSRRRIAVIGDSTFFHSGMTGLLNVVYNKSGVITFVVDNSTTGMTGHQHHPGTGRTLMGDETKAVDPAAVARAYGIEKTVVVDPYQVRETQQVVRTILKEPGPAVVISRRPCALLVRLREPPKKVDRERCVGCKTCLALGCPAIAIDDDKATIIDTLCVGCGMCANVCPKGVIS